MPNQLSASKRRQSLAEHAAVLAALAQIAKREQTTVMALLREAAREVVRKRAQQTDQADQLRATVWNSAPRPPKQFKTAAQLARFKRAQREFDQVVLEMQLAAPQDVQARNSITAHRRPVLLDFDRAHAPSL
jgi:hypothetical protein